MANFTLQLTVGVAKGAAAQWFYAQNSVGHSYGNPVDVQIGDTVTFTRTTSSAGTAKVRLLNIFTNNADIDLTSSAPTVVRTVASGGTTLDTISGRNQGESVTDDLFIERQAVVTVFAPTASSVTFNNPASANTTATVNLSASGSGGTLQYALSLTDSTPDNWQSGSTFTVSRGSGTVYARARRSSTTNSNVVTATRPGFLIGDTGVNPSSSTIAHNATAASTVVTYGTYGEAYSARVNNGSTNLGATIANSVGTATISFTSSLPSVGSSTTYEIFVRRPTSTGGDGSTYHATNDTFTVTRSALAPTASSVTFNNPASTSITATVNLSASGSGGTLQYACEVGDTTPDNWQSGSTFTISRGSGTVYAQARRSSTLVSSVVNATRPAFLIGDTGVNPSNSTIAWNDTSEITTVAFGTAGETYAVRLNNGSTNLGTALAPAGSPSTIYIPFSTSLPTAGNTTTYEIFVRRPTSTGGDGSTYHATNDTFTVTRSVQPDTGAPVITRLGNATVTFDAGGTYNDAGATAYDTVDGTITSSIVTVNPVNVNAAGTYTVTYNVSDSAGNAATQVTRSVTVSDRTPNAFNLVNPANATPGTLATSVGQQITGMDNGTPCSVSGQGSPQLQVGGGNNAWVTSSTINPNLYINVRLTASTSFNTTHTATLTIGTGTDTIAVTSSADTSGGGSTGVAGGSGSHGIQVFDTNGSTSVISPSTRYMTRLVDPVSISVTAGNSTLISCVMTGLTTSNSQVVFEGYMPVSQVPVTLESNGFRITNNSSQTISNVVYVTRF